MLSSFDFSELTQAANTPIVQVIPPLVNSSNVVSAGAKTRLLFLTYTAAGTAHDVVVMRSLNSTRTTEAAAATATSLVLAEVDMVGDTIASGDYLVVQHTDGSFGAYLASALASFTVTIGALAKGVALGGKVWIMGAPSDTTYHRKLTTTANTANTWNPGVSGICTSGFNTGAYAETGKGEPLIVYSANATNAGTIKLGSVGYVSG